ncbi:AraC family transcriptional regulator [Arenibacter palladensis]|uniref:helix-turn-helix domain-containing protein n=1 Tax=Arenibacter palladensis TaxID=237373 RepID=UPI002FD042CC
MGLTRKELLVTNKEVTNIGLWNSRRCTLTNKETDQIVLEKSTSTFISDELKGKIGGWQEEIRTDKAMILIRKLSLTDEFVEEVKGQDSYIGIHFIMKGSYECRRRKDSFNLAIPSGSFNIVHWSNDLIDQKLSGANYEALEIFFKGEFLEELLGNEYNVDNKMFAYNTSLGYWSTAKPMTMSLHLAISEILNCNLTSNAKVYYLESKIRLLLIDLFLGQEKQIGRNREVSLSASDYETIENLVHYIETHLKKPLTIKELSAVAGYNTTKLKSYFKKVHNTTIFKFITSLRMQKAKALILEDNYTIAQASYEVGYSNPQHFTVAFKKNMGYLPSALLGMDQ